jgi:hypothetical protein
MREAMQKPFFGRARPAHYQRFPLIELDRESSSRPNADDDDEIFQGKRKTPFFSTQTSNYQIYVHANSIIFF